MNASTLLETFLTSSANASICLIDEVTIALNTPSIEPGDEAGEVDVVDRVAERVHPGVGGLGATLVAELLPGGVRRPVARSGQGAAGPATGAMASGMSRVSPAGVGEVLRRR